MSKNNSIVNIWSVITRFMKILDIIIKINYKYFNKVFKLNVVIEQ